MSFLSKQKQTASHFLQEVGVPTNGLVDFTVSLKTGSDSLHSLSPNLVQSKVDPVTDNSIPQGKTKIPLDISFDSGDDLDDCDSDNTRNVQSINRSKCNVEKGSRLSDIHHVRTSGRSIVTSVDSKFPEPHWLTHKVFLKHYENDVCTVHCIDGEICQHLMYTLRPITVSEYRCELSKTKLFCTLSNCVPNYDMFYLTSGINPSDYKMCAIYDDFDIIVKPFEPKITIVDTPSNVSLQGISSKTNGRKCTSTSGSKPNALSREEKRQIEKSHFVNKNKFNKKKFWGMSDAEIKKFQQFNLLESATFRFNKTRRPLKDIRTVTPKNINLAQCLSSHLCNDNYLTKRVNVTTCNGVAMQINKPGNAKVRNVQPVTNGTCVNLEDVNAFPPLQKTKYKVKYIDKIPSDGMISVDPLTKQMLVDLGFGGLKNLKVEECDNSNANTNVATDIPRPHTSRFVMANVEYDISFDVHKDGNATVVSLRKHCETIWRSFSKINWPGNGDDNVNDNIGIEVEEEAVLLGTPAVIEVTEQKPVMLVEHKDIIIQKPQLDKILDTITTKPVNVNGNTVNNKVTFTTPVKDIISDKIIDKGLVVSNDSGIYSKITSVLKDLYVNYGTYGNYGGPSYTGGKYEGTDFGPPPIDKLDAIFKAHDYAYHIADEQKDPFLNIGVRNFADELLVKGIVGIEQWLQSQSKTTQTYAFGAKSVFSLLPTLRGIAPITPNLQSQVVFSTKDITKHKPTQEHSAMFDEWCAENNVFNNWDPVPRINEDVQDYILRLKAKIGEPLLQRFFHSSLWMKIKVAFMNDKYRTKIFQQVHELGWNPGSDWIVVVPMLDYKFQYDNMTYGWFGMPDYPPNFIVIVTPGQNYGASRRRYAPTVQHVTLTNWSTWIPDIYRVDNGNVDPDWGLYQFWSVSPTIHSVPMIIAYSDLFSNFVEYSNHFKTVDETRKLVRNLYDIQAVVTWLGAIKTKMLAKSFGSFFLPLLRCALYNHFFGFHTQMWRWTGSGVMTPGVTLTAPNAEWYPLSPNRIEAPNHFWATFVTMDKYYYMRNRIVNTVGNVLVADLDHAGNALGDPNGVRYQFIPIPAEMENATQQGLALWTKCFIEYPFAGSSGFNYFHVDQAETQTNVLGGASPVSEYWRLPGYTGIEVIYVYTNRMAQNAPVFYTQTGAQWVVSDAAAALIGNNWHDIINLMAANPLSVEHQHVTTILNSYLGNDIDMDMISALLPEMALSYTRGRIVGRVDGVPSIQQVINHNPAYVVNHNEVFQLIDTQLNNNNDTALGTLRRVIGDYTTPCFIPSLSILDVRGGEGSIFCPSFDFDVAMVVFARYAFIKTSSSKIVFDRSSTSPFIHDHACLRSRAMDVFCQDNDIWKDMLCMRGDVQTRTQYNTDFRSIVEDIKDAFLGGILKVNRHVNFPVFGAAEIWWGRMTPNRNSVKDNLTAERLGLTSTMTPDWLLLPPFSCYDMKYKEHNILTPWSNGNTERVITNKRDASLMLGHGVMWRSRYDEDNALGASVVSECGDLYMSASNIIYNIGTHLPVVHFAEGAVWPDSYPSPPTSVDWSLSKSFKPICGTTFNNEYYDIIQMNVGKELFLPNDVFSKIGLVDVKPLPKLLFKSKNGLLPVEEEKKT